MKKYTKELKFTMAEMYGRIPIPKKGGAMTPKKGRGSYKRKGKHKGRSEYDRPFFCLIGRDRRNRTLILWFGITRNAIIPCPYLAEVERIELSYQGSKPCALPLSYTPTFIYTN